MAAQPTVPAAQRRHWKANAVGAPLHVPSRPVSVCPTSGVPSIVGDTVALGAAAGATAVPATASVTGEPPAACAVTETESVWPASAAVGLYVSEIAPGIGAQPPAVPPQRCH